MNYIAGVFLFHMSEEEAFWCVVAYFKSFDILGFYEHGMQSLVNNLANMGTYISILFPKLRDHFGDENIQPFCYATPYFLTFFTYNLPVRSVTRVWDLVFLMQDFTHRSWAVIPSANEQWMPHSLSPVSTQFDFADTYQSPLRFPSNQFEPTADAMDQKVQDLDKAIQDNGNGDNQQEQHPDQVHDLSANDAHDEKPQCENEGTHQRTHGLERQEQPTENYVGAVLPSCLRDAELGEEVGSPYPVNPEVIINPTHTQYERRMAVTMRLTEVSFEEDLGSGGSHGELPGEVGPHQVNHSCENSSPAQHKNKNTNKHKHKHKHKQTQT